MIAFEVRVNKVRVCTAGMGELDGIIAGLTSTINKDGRVNDPKIAFHVSGAADKEAFRWVQQTLAVGDRVEIRVLDTARVDAPAKIECKEGACGV
jgi:hypothetical protein